MKKHLTMAFRSVSLKSVPVLLFAVMAMSGCRDDFGGYYDQPSWVETSSAKVLASRSDCQTYLQLVEKTLFSKQMEGSGQYTFIVPTDQAFADFFASNPYGYKSVDDIPEEVAARMVSSWMLYNAYPCDSISNKLTGFNTWERGTAFKHQTPSYDVLRQVEVNGKQTYVYDSYLGTFTLNNNAPTLNNYRYLPVFTQRFLSANSISSADWQSVVGSTFSPYGNYLSAGIVEVSAGSGDLYCQNGVIHLVNKVVMPLENMDALISDYGSGESVSMPAEAAEGAWSLLNRIVNHKGGDGAYQFLSYTDDATASHYFAKAYPELDLSNLKLRSYKNDVSPFRLNMEDYRQMALNTTLGYTSLGDMHYDDLNGGMTFFVPTEAALKQYIRERLFKYVDVESGWENDQEQFDAAFNKLSENVLPILWSAMQADGTIWPSQFSNAENSVGQTEHIDGYDPAVTYENSVVASGFASNGLWNITRFVPKTAAFEGIASRMLLDPAYSYEELLVTSFLPSSMYGNLLASRLSGKSDVNMTMILWGDENARWWDDLYFNGALSSFVNQTSYNAVSGSSTSATSARSATSRNTALLQMIRRNYIERLTSDPLDLAHDPLAGAYGGWAYTNTSSGEVIRYRLSGQMVEGQPEIQIQSAWNLANDAEERAMYAALSTDHDAMPASLQQSEPSSDRAYVSVYKDPSQSEYINGNIYLAAKHSVPSYYNVTGTLGDGEYYYGEDELTRVSRYLNAYLVADSVGAQEHTLFKQYWDYALANAAGGTASLNIGSGYWTLFIPTDEALREAIDRKLMFNIANVASLAAGNADANYVDSCCYIVNAYITRSGCYPDDGLSAFYEPTEAWSGIGGTSRNATSHYLVTTNNKIVDMDRTVGDRIVKAWEGLISGATMSGYVDKIGGQLQYTGRVYTSGANQCVDVYNANEITAGKFDNRVVRAPGKSNIICPQGVIHSLNGFVVYKIAAR